ncbi:MAG: hypothetical protein HY816_03790 [Candidatus Wallbacteria bacterium]|nr:hypothetical protein [Candidatus Wallbacteria bacterium]
MKRAGREPEGIVVPLDVEAMCLGAKDVGSTVLAGAHVDFSRLTALEYRPERVMRLPRRLATDEDVGIHLHWALPRPLDTGIVVDRSRANSLTGDSAPGVERDGASSSRAPAMFLPAPNRWLVVRVTDSAATSEAWVVESDFLSFEPKWGGVSVPIRPRDGRAHAYMGRSCPLRQWIDRGSTDSLAAWSRSWLEPEGDRAAGEVPKKLTAAGWGDPAFAAYYPSCRNVFGFHDPLLGADGKRLLDGRYGYLIVGWHRDADDDVVLGIGSRWADLQLPKVPWALPNNVSLEGLPKGTRSFYRGWALAVEWKDTAAPFSARPPNTRLALGNSAPEAYSALLASDVADAVEKHETERLLNALIAGLDDSMSAIDKGKAHVDAELHALRFLPSDGGTNWIARAKRKPTQHGPESQVEEFPPLPANLAEAAALLSTVQRQLDYARRRFTACRRRVLDSVSILEQMAWDPKSCTADETSWSPIRVQLHDRLDRDLAELYSIDLTALRRSLDLAGRSARAALETAPDHEIVPVPGPRFWRPRDPVLAVSQEEIRVGEREPSGVPPEGYQEAPSDFLRCKLVSQLDDSARARELADRLQFRVLPHAGACTALLAELVRRSEESPSKALADGRGTWLPFFASWSAKLNPVHPILPPKGAYEADVLEKGWHAGGDQEDEVFAELYSDSARKLESELRLEGLGLVETTLVRGMATRLATKLEELPRKLPESVAPNPANPVVTFPLTGFHDLLLMRQPVIRLALDERIELLHLQGRPKWIVEAQVGDALGPNVRFPQFLPLRAGAFSLEHVELIDVFGRVAAVPAANATVAASLAGPGPARAPANLAVLPPRLGVPARLAFRWKVSDPSSPGPFLDSQHHHAPSSPVSGWLIPSRLEKALVVCTHDGEISGLLREPEKAVATAHFEPAPGLSREEALRGLRKPLREMIEGLEGSPLEELLEKLDREIDDIVPELDTAVRGSSAVMGRPLAVVTAELGVDLKGDWAPRRLAVCNPLEAAEGDAGFRAIRIPVLLGDPTRKNDGLAGYFVAGDPLTATALRTPARPLNTVGGKLQTPLTLTASNGRDNRVRLTMLVDPDAPVHATTGIFPVKGVSIPPALYRTAAKKLGLLFGCGPILFPAEGGWNLPLPAIEGQSWFMTRETGKDAKWSSVGAPGKLQACAELPTVEELAGRIWLTLRTKDVPGEPERQ